MSDTPYLQESYQVIARHGRMLHLQKQSGATSCTGCRGASPNDVIKLELDIDAEVALPDIDELVSIEVSRGFLNKTMWIIFGLPLMFILMYTFIFEWLSKHLGYTPLAMLLLILTAFFYHFVKVTLQNRQEQCYKHVFIRRMNSQIYRCKMIN